VVRSFILWKNNSKKPELLSEKEGNGWRPEKGADKVDALKGSLLRAQGLPSLLQLHLKRFRYDWQTDVMSKINDKFEFPEVRAPFYFYEDLTCNLFINRECFCVGKAK